MAELTNEVARKNLGEIRAGTGRIDPAELDEVWAALEPVGIEDVLGQWQGTMIEFQGELTASMVYDTLPIVDHFKRVDDTTLLGIMNGKPEVVLDNGNHLYFALVKA